ncbi:hypothetical protein ACPXB3_21775 [Gordonia sp. DT219]|uniref:hypothetical protein n=1 Tax=Gordonia sp. DT219 TaxID=3416658 RepID=UPI003CF16F38
MRDESMSENGNHYGERSDIPDDFRWIKLWPNSMSLVPKAVAVAIVVLSLFVLARHGPVFICIGGFLAGSVVLLGSVAPNRPAVTLTDTGVRLGYRVWAPSSPTYLLGAATSLLVFMAVGGALGLAPQWFAYGGAIGAVLCGGALVIGSVVRSRALLNIDATSCTVKIHHDHWRVTLSDELDLVADIDHSAGDQPCLRFSCPPGTSVDLTTAEPRTNVDKVEHVIRSKDFTVEANALASTLFFLRSHPDVKVSPQALSRMLIPPPRSVRRRLAIKEAIAYEW